MFQPLELGSALKPIAIERYKASEHHEDVIAVVSRKIAGVHMHYREGIGFFYCFGGKCCEDLSLPQVRYVLPVLVYSTQDVTTRSYGLPITMKYLILGRDAYESQILTKERINSNLHVQDLLVTCTDEGYQKLSFDIVGPAKWRDPKNGMTDLVKSLWAEYQRLIAMSVARKLTPEKYAELVEKSLEDKGKKDRVPPERQRIPAPDVAVHKLELHAPPSGDGLDLGAPLPTAALPSASDVDILDEPVAAGSSMKKAEVVVSGSAGIPAPGASKVSFEDLVGTATPTPTPGK